MKKMLARSVDLTAILIMRKHTADKCMCVCAWGGDSDKHERATRNTEKRDCRLKSTECTTQNKLVLCQREASDRDSVCHTVAGTPGVQHLKHHNQTD